MSVHDTRRIGGPLFTGCVCWAGSCAGVHTPVASTNDLGVAHTVLLCHAVLCHTHTTGRFVTFGKEGVIDVNGPAEVTPTAGGERIKATFTEAELKWNGIT